MNKEQEYMFTAMLGSTADECYDVSLIDCAFEFEKVVEELEDLKKKLESGKHICPLCKTDMKKVVFKGYYDELEFWSCKCGWDENDNDVEVWKGEYAY